MSKQVHAVVGILRRDKTLLVAKRPPGKPYADYWEFPGGKVESQESSRQALARELHEELGIDIISAQPWKEYPYAYPERTVFLEIWLVDQFVGEPAGQENQILRWVTIAEFLELRLLGGIFPVINEIKTLCA